MRNKTLVSTCRKVCLSAYKKNQLRPSLLFCDIAKKLQTCSLGNLNMPGYDKQKRYYELVENSFIFMQKKSNLSLPSFLKYYRDIANLLFWVLWGRLPKTKALNCWKLWCLSAKKSTWSLNFFYRYYTLKNPVIWLANNTCGN